MDAFNTEAMKLAVMGVTVTVSSGDDGVASQTSLCNYNSGSVNSDWPVCIVVYVICIVYVIITLAV